MPSGLAILTYLKQRIKYLAEDLLYYEQLEKERGLLMRDEELVYNNTRFAMNELERMVQFIEASCEDEN